MTKFRHIPWPGRVIIVTVAIAVLAIAIVACATSYNAIYRLVGMLGLYDQGITRVFPILLDAAFLVGEAAMILCGIMLAVTRSDEVSPIWPGAIMAVCGLCTIAFNVAHAYLIGGLHDPLTLARCLVASLPPILMIISFQALIAIVKWTMLHLGRTEQTFGARTEHSFGGAGLLGVNPQTQMPSGERLLAEQSGHGGGAATTKREHVQAYLARLGPSANILTAREIKEDLAEEGVNVSEQYVGRVMGAHGSSNGQRK